VVELLIIIVQEQELQVAAVAVLVLLQHQVVLEPQDKEIMVDLVL
jgi:hypothetical protein